MEEKLLKELFEECDRLSEIMSSFEVGDETWKMAHSRKLDILEKMQAFYKVETEYQIKFEDREAERDHNEQMEALEEKKLEQQLKIEKIRAEEARALEEKKLEQHLVIERLRAEEARALEDMKKSWKTFAFAIGTVVLPELVKMIYHNAHTDKILGFEEHGRIISSIGRQLKLPRIF